MNMRTAQWVNEQVKDCGRRFGFVVDNLDSCISKNRGERVSFSENSSLALTFNKNRISIIGTGKKNAGRIGVSQCSANDDFDARIGIAIAWARYKGIAIPATFVPASRLDALERGCRFRYEGKKYRVLDTTKTGVYVQKKNGKIRLFSGDSRVEVL